MLDIFEKFFESRDINLPTFWLELVLFLAVLAITIFMLVRYIRSKLITLFYSLIIFAFVLSIVFTSKIGLGISAIAYVLLSISMMLYYIPAYKQGSIKKISGKPSKEFLSNQEVKEELIETLIHAVDHLSSRKIGAIITIEKEHTLNTLVEGAVKLDAVVSFELLETIFHPNTALHDGAVIIRGDRIKCASAFYQPSQKKDIPQHYGSRHRAAIGISEQSDAFTIVVSEETGHIAITIGGTITGNVSLESLRTSLDQQLIVR